MRKGLKVVLGIVVAIAVVFVLFEFVFPWVDREFFADPRLEAAPAASVREAAAG